MRKQLSLAAAFALAVVCLLVLGAQTAFAYPSSFSGTWYFDSRDGVSCTWSVFDNFYPSSVYLTRDRLVVTNEITCNATLFDLATGAGVSWGSFPGESAGGTGWALSSVSNDVTGGNSTGGTCGRNTSYCRQTTTFDAIPPGTTVTIDPQSVRADIQSNSSSNTDIWISAPCDSGGTGGALCDAPVTLTAS
jgi:hypothetical protein